MCDEKEEELCECGGRFNRFVEPRLLLLLIEGKSYGYELVSRLNEISFPGDPLDAGNVYRNLRRMEKEELVESEWAMAKSGPPKRVYRITIEGEDRLHAWTFIFKKRKEAMEKLLEKYYRLQKDKNRK